MTRVGQAHIELDASTQRAQAKITAFVQEARKQLEGLANLNVGTGRGSTGASGNASAARAQLEAQRLAAAATRTATAELQQQAAAARLAVAEQQKLAAQTRTAATGQSTAAQQASAATRQQIADARLLAAQQQAAAAAARAAAAAAVSGSQQQSAAARAATAQLALQAAQQRAAAQQTTAQARQQEQAAAAVVRTLQNQQQASVAAYNMGRTSLQQMLSEQRALQQQALQTAQTYGQQSTAYRQLTATAQAAQRAMDQSRSRAGNDQIAQLRAQLSGLRAEYERSVGAAGRFNQMGQNQAALIYAQQLAALRTQIQAVGQQSGLTAQQMTALNNMTAQVSAQTNALNGAFSRVGMGGGLMNVLRTLPQFAAQAGGSLGAASSQAMALSGSLGGVSAAAGSAGIAVGVVTATLTAFTVAALDSTQAAIQFEAGMAKVSTLMDEQPAQLGTMANGILEISKRTGAAAQDLQNGLYDIMGASVQGTESQAAALTFLEQATRLATAGMTSTATATDVMTSVMNAYSLSATDAGLVSDKLFKAVDMGKMNFEEFAQSFGMVTAVSSQAGVALDETLAALATMTSGGIKASSAVDYLRSLIKAIVAPGEQAGAILTDLGIEFGESALKAKGLTGVLQEVMDKTGGNTETLARLFGGVEALTAATSIARDEFGRMEGSLTGMADAAGTTDEAYEKVASTTQKAIDRLKASFEALKIQVGTGLLPGVSGFIDGLTGMVDAAAEFSRNMQSAATEWKPYWDAIAPELEMVANSVGSVLAGLYEIVKGALSLITQVFGATFTALWPLISPALEMLMGFITTALESIGATFKATGLALQGDWKGAWDTLNKNSEEQLKQLETTINDTAPRLLEAGSNLGSALLNGFEGVAAGFTSIVADMLATGAEWIDQQAPAWAKSITSAIAGAFRGAASGLFDESTGAFQEAGGNLAGLGAAFGPGSTEGTSAVARAIVDQAFKSRGDNQADNIVDRCARWVRDTLGDALPQARAEIDRLFQSNPGASGVPTAVSAANNFKRAGLAKAYTGVQDLKPGDTIFYVLNGQNHVGTYVGDGMVRGNNRVSNSKTGNPVGNVAINSLGTPNLVVRADDLARYLGVAPTNQQTNDDVTSDARRGNAANHRTPGAPGYTPAPAAPAAPATPKSFDAYIKEAQRIQAAIDRAQAQGPAGAEAWRKATAELERFRESSPLAAQAIQWLSTQTKTATKTTSQYGQTFDRLSDQLNIVDSLGRLGESSDSVIKKLGGIRDEARRAAENEKARYGETEKYLKLLDLAADAQGKIDALKKSANRSSSRAAKPEDVGLTAAQWEKHGTKALSYVTRLHELEKTGTDAQILAQRNLLDAYKAQSAVHAKALEYAEEVYDRRNSGSAKTPQDAGLTVDQWNRYGEKAMRLVRDVNKARDAGDRNGLIAAQRQLNLFRQQSDVHENVASFAEQEVARLDKADKDRKESEKEAAKTQADLDKQLAQGRIDLAQQSLDKLEAQRTRDLQKAGDDAAARLQIEQTLGKQILAARKAVAAKARDLALAEADKLTDEGLKQQRKDKAQGDYDLAVDAAQDEYNERVANAQKTRDKAAETSSELRLSIARALTDGELDLAEQSAQGVINSYRMALEAAGDSAQERARVQEEWAQQAADAEIAIAEVASRRRVLALQRERNRLVNQEGVTLAERQAIWKQYGDRIAAEETALGQTVAGIQQKWGLEVGKAQEAASEEVKKVAKTYSELKDEVNRLIESGEWNAETQRDVAAALILLDSTAEAAGVSLADLVVAERESMLGAMANADALRGFVRELKEAGATAEEVKAAVRGGTELQDALYGARGTLAANRDGQYDINALRERSFELDSLIRRIDALQANPGTDPYIEGLLEKIPLLRDVLVPLLKEVNDEVTSLEDRRVAATTAGKVATLTRDLNGLDRRVARGQRTPEEAIEERRRLSREIAELEWTERQRSEEFRKLTDEEEANERQAHLDRLLAIDQTYWDQKDELERTRRYAREDRVAEGEMADLEWQHGQRLMSTQAYLDQRDQLLTEAAWREYARVVATNGDIEAAGLALDNRLTEITRQGIRDREALDYGLTQYKELSASAEELVYRFEDGAISLGEFWTQATAAALRMDALAASARAVGNTSLAEQFERDARTLRSALPTLEAVTAEMRTLHLLAVTDGDANDRAAYLAGILGTEEYANKAVDTLRQLAAQLRSLQNQGDEGGAAQVAATIQLYKDGLPPIVQQTLQKKLLADITDQLAASERELGLTTEQARTPAEEWLMLLGDLVEAGLITAETYEEVRKRIQGVIDAQKELGKNKDWEKRLQDAAALFNRGTPVGGGLAAALDGLAAWFGAGGQGGGSKAVLTGAAAFVGGLKGVFQTGSEETDQVVNTFVGGIQATLMKLASGDMLGAAVAGVATVVATIVDIFQGGVASAKKAKQEIEQATSNVKIFDVGKYASVQRRKGFWGWLGFKQSVIDQESVSIAQSLGDAITSAVSGGIMNGLRQGQSSFKVVGEAISADFGAALLQTIIDTFIQSVVVQELLQPYLDAYVDAVKRKDSVGIQRAGADMQRAIVDVNGVIADAYETVFVPAAKELGVFGKDAGGQSGVAQQELFGAGPDALYGVPTIEPSPEQKALVSQAAQVVADLGGAVSEWRAGNAEFRAFIAGEMGRPPAMSGNGGLT